MPRKKKFSSASQSMCDALDAQNLETIQSLLDTGESINSFYDRGVYANASVTLLMKAVIDVQVDLVRFLLEKSADTEIPCLGGETPLTKAAFLGSFEIVELLVQSGANIRYKTPNRWTALMWCQAQADSKKTNKLKVQYQRVARFLESKLWTDLEENDTE